MSTDIQPAGIPLKQADELPDAAAPLSGAADPLYQTIGNSVAMAAANAVYAQQQANVTYQASTTLAVAKLDGAKDS